MQPILGYHFDLKRAQWTRSQLDRTVDRLAAWGFNTILLEIEDKFRFRRHPDIAHRDAWPADRWADWAAACRAQGLNVVPLVQSIGHAEYVLRKTAYRHLRDNPDAFSGEKDPDKRRELVLDEIKRNQAENSQVRIRKGEPASEAGRIFNTRGLSARSGQAGG